MKRVILLIALGSYLFGANAQDQISPIQFDQIGSSSLYTMTVSVPCDANERAVVKSYDASTKTFTIRAIPSSLPAQTQFVTYNYGIIPVVGDEYVSDADTTFKKKKGRSYVIYDD